jgi:cytochrome c553
MRNWDLARAKVLEESVCRACQTTRNLEAAHIIPRSRVSTGGEHPANIVPLCRKCHQAQHAGRLELLPLLDKVEQSYIAGLVGIAEAYRRTTRPGAWG